MVDKENLKNKDGYLATPFDGKKALIVGEHPHKGETATCIGAEKLNIGAGWGLRFRGDYNEFYIMNHNNVQWL